MTSRSRLVAVARRILHVVLRQVRQQRLDVLDRVGLVGGEVVRDAGLGVVGARAAELLHADVLAGDGLDDVGPVMNMCEVLSTMTVKSVTAGEYTAPPAQGPMISEICGMTPEACTLRRKISPYRPSETTPSWMRAAARVDDADDRAAGLHREVHDLDDLLAGDLAERAAEDREVLGVDGDRCGRRWCRSR